MDDALQDMGYIKNGSINPPFCKPSTEQALPAVAPDSIISLQTSDSFVGSSFSWYEINSTEQNRTLFDVLSTSDKNRMSQ
jgi:hypothetical protein